MVSEYDCHLAHPYFDSNQPHHFFTPRHLFLLHQRMFVYIDATNQSDTPHESVI